MNTNVHIERLVLHGISLSPHARPLLQAAVEVELAHLLASGGVSDALHSGGAVCNVKTGEVQLTNNAEPARLGVQIARAVYGGIGR